MKSVILSSTFLKTLNTATIAGMPPLCRLATQSCRCWKLIAQWIICQLHNVTVGIHLSHSLHFSVLSPLLSICLLLSLSLLSVSISIHQSQSYCLCCGIDCRNWGPCRLKWWTTVHTRGTWSNQDGGSGPMGAHTSFSGEGVSSYLSVFDYTHSGGGSSHCTESCGVPQK